MCKHEIRKEVHGWWGVSNERYCVRNQQFIACGTCRKCPDYVFMPLDVTNKDKDNEKAEG